MYIHQNRHNNVSTKVTKVGVDESSGFLLSWFVSALSVPLQWLAPLVSWTRTLHSNIADPFLPVLLVDADLTWQSIWCQCNLLIGCAPKRNRFWMGSLIQCNLSANPPLKNKPFKLQRRGCEPLRVCRHHRGWGSHFPLQGSNRIFPLESTQTLGCDLRAVLVRWDGGTSKEFSCVEHFGGVYSIAVWINNWSARSSCIWEWSTQLAELHLTNKTDIRHRSPKGRSQLRRQSAPLWERSKERVKSSARQSGDQKMKKAQKCNFPNRVKCVRVFGVKWEWIPKPDNAPNSPSSKLHHSTDKMLDSGVLSVVNECACF